MLQWITLLPVVFPVAFTALFYLFISRTFPQFRSRFAITFILIELSLVGINAFPFEHRLTLSSWTSASFSPSLEFDGIAFYLLLASYLALGVLWLIIPTTARLDVSTSLVMASATMLVLAANLPAIYFAWVLFDGSIFAWRLVHDVEKPTALRSLILGQIGALSLFAGAQLLGTNLTDRGMLLIALAFWARLGVFPFHWMYPLRGVDSRDLWFSRALPLAASSALWIRWPAFQVQPPGQLFAILGILAVFATAIWMWHEEQPARTVTHGVWHAVPFIPLAVAYGGDSGSLLALELTTGLIFSLLLFEVALRWRAKYQGFWLRVLWLLGVLCVAGIPVTPAFLGRVGVYSFFLESGNSWLTIVLIFFVAVILALLADYGRVLEGVEPRDLNSSERSGIALLLFAFAAFTLGALPIALSLGTPIFDSTQAAFVFAANNALLVMLALILVLIPAVAAYALQRVARNLRSRPRQPLSRLADAFELGWLERIATGVGYETGATARNLAAIAEDNPTVWILLVALWVAILTTLPR